MPEKLSHSQFMERLNKIRDDVEILEEYQNSYTKIQLKCKSCGRVYSTYPHNLLHGYKCRKCYNANRFKSFDDYKQEVYQCNPNIIVYDDYEERKNKFDKCTFECKICGYIFETTPSRFLRSKCKCSKCEGNVPYNSEDIIEKIHNCNPKINILEPTDSFTGVMKCECMECKYIWNTEVSHFIYRNATCPMCSYKELGKQKRKSNDEFLAELAEKNMNDLTILEPYQTITTPIKIQCNKCRHIWKTSPEMLLLNTGCPICKTISKGENKIESILSKEKIYHIRQYKFDDLKGVGDRKLSYDFYIPDYNLLIEFQGTYHDGKAPRQTEERLIIQKEHDKRKREYAEKNGYDLLEIWYYDYKNIEKILYKQLNL